MNAHSATTGLEIVAVRNALTVGVDSLMVTKNAPTAGSMTDVYSFFCF